MAAITYTDPINTLMMEEFDSERGLVTKEKFLSNADVIEGVNGRHRIDSTFENTDYELLKGECNSCGGDIK